MKTEILYGFLKAVISSNDYNDYGQSETLLYINGRNIDIEDIDVENGDVYIEVNETQLKSILEEDNNG